MRQPVRHFTSGPTEYSVPSWSVRTVFGMETTQEIDLSAVLRQDDVFAPVRRAVVSVGGLVSQADLARRWKLSKPRIHQLVQHETFPEPATMVNGQPVWFAQHADLWLEHRELLQARAAHLAIP